MEQQDIAMLKCLFLSTALFCLTETTPAAPVKIVAAENFYGGVAHEIAESAASVVSILTNPNQDPHEFTSSAGTAKAVADADIVIYNGVGYDTWMDRLLRTPGNPRRLVIKVSDLMGAKDGDNPHIWYSPTTMPALVDKLAPALAQMDGKDASLFQKRAAQFRDSMHRELDKIAAVKAAAGGCTVTATEPVFGYMADALGLKMLNGSFQVKIMNDAEPSASETVAFERSLRTHAARLLFYNSQVTDPTTARIQKIARDSGVPVVGVTETQPLDQATYREWMLHELDAVQAALPAKKG